MQTARLKAESQGRKAKVIPVYHLVLALSNEGSAVGTEELTFCVTACQFIP